MPKTETNLLPCPFCGADAKIGRNFGRISADCSSCGVSVRSVSVSDDDAKKEVAQIWNQRVEPVHISERRAYEMFTGRKHEEQ